MNNNNFDEPWFEADSFLHKILLVEDNVMDSTLVEKILNFDEQFEITVVTTLKNALKALSERKFDAIILDLNLPDEHGVNTFDSVATMAKETAIVVLTAIEDKKLGIHLIKAGAQDFITKSKLTTYPLANTIIYSIERQSQLIHARKRGLISNSSNDQALSKTNTF